MGKGKQALLAAAVLACAGAADEAAAQQARVEYSDVFTTQEPGVPSGRHNRNDYGREGDPSGKSPTMKHLKIELPPGARFDTAAVPRCAAPDPEVAATDGDACPKESLVGTEVYVIDTGFPDPNRYVTVDIKFFNERDGLIVYTHDRSAGSRLVIHAKLTAATGPGGAFLTTPPTCPPEGYWTFRATFSYLNGEEHVRESRSPCKAGATTPQQRLTFFRRQRARAGRRGMLRLRAGAAAT